MLNRLIEYGAAHGLRAEPGFAPKAVRWALSFAEDGRFLGVVELGEAGQKRNPGRTFPVCPTLGQPELVRTRGCHFLIEAASVVALHGAEEGDENTLRKHRCFIQHLENAFGDGPVGKAAATLGNADELVRIRAALADHAVKPTDRVTVRVGGQFPVESDDWHAWWRTYRAGIFADDSASAETPEMRCLVTGDLVEPAPTHDEKIRALGAVGGLAVGCALTSFKEPAYQSYGLKQSYNAAMSTETAKAYCSALNDLIEKHSTRLAGALVVHWFSGRVPDEDDPLPWLQDPSAGAAEADEIDAQRRATELLNAIRAGQRPDLAGNRYYAATVSGAAARVMVRDWMEGSFESLLRAVELWFGDLAIVSRFGDSLAPSPKFLAVLASTVRDLDDVPAPFVSAMWRVAVSDAPIPVSALAQALGRFRVQAMQDDPFNHAGVGLMRAYHVRQQRQKGGSDMSALGPMLNEDHPSKAYQCGRLMAVLARLQHAALGDVGAGVVQRYYAAASSTPALVLGRLVRTSQHHLAKLDRGLAFWYEGVLADIHAKLGDGPPRTLDLEGQSLFALGYYQQIAHMRSSTKKSDETDETRAADAAEGDAHDGRTYQLPL